MTDPLHDLKGVNLTGSFSNTFSNARGYVRSNPNVDEIKRQYSFRIRTRVDTCEPKRSAWHASETALLHLQDHRLP
jgi:hypothetical protein